MIKFDRQLRSHKDGKECVRFIKKELKGILKLFNKGLKPTNLRDAPFIVKPPSRLAQPTFPANAAMLAASGVPIPAMSGVPAPSIPVPPNGFASWPTFATMPPSIGAANANGVVGTFPTNAPLFTALGGGPVPPWLTGFSSTVPTIAATGSMASASSAVSRGGQTLTYTAPKTLTTGIPSNALVAPSSLCTMKDNCVVCHER